jgi:hypothetical protein
MVRKIYCFIRHGRDGGVELAPCEVLRDTSEGTLVRRNDGQRFWVGVRDEQWYAGVGWIEVFYPEEAEYC